jgi:hypothetical protein
LKEPAARKSTNAGEQIKNLDLLSLKKLVIEDLKNEIQLVRPDPSRESRVGRDYPPEVNIRGNAYA